MQDTLDKNNRPVTFLWLNCIKNDFPKNRTSRYSFWQEATYYFAEQKNGREDAWDKFFIFGHKKHTLQVYICHVIITKIRI